MEKLRLSALSRSLAERVARVALKLSSADVSVTAIALGDARVGVSSTPVRVAVNVCDTETVPSDRFTVKFSLCWFLSPSIALSFGT